MNIVLIGMRGSGKSEVAQILGKLLKRKVIETDRLIEKKFMKPIDKIVQQFGWQQFRQYEEKIVTQVSKLDNIIIASGGGVVISVINIKHLKENGELIWLNASIKILYKRIGSDTKRPLLTDSNNMKQDIEKVYRIRKNLYKNAADYIINTDKYGINEIANKIIMFIKTQKDYIKLLN